MTRDEARRSIPRRKFIARSAALGAFTIAAPSVARSWQANSVLEIGLIGCGGRGGWIADLFEKSGKYKVAACADYFQDRAETTGKRFGVPASACHSTLSGYKRLLDSKVTVAVIESPPYFHPEQAAQAVEAGKHVFCAKPIAVDAAGCLSIGASGKKATEKKLAFLVDFQTRASPLFREALRRVRAGDIGSLVMGESFYPWAGGGRGAPPANPEEQLRNWYYVKALSGDFIVEQSIHSLDVATWIANADPIRARGTGGRKLRPEGSIWDHFAVTYWFPGDYVLSFTCIQSVPGIRDEIRCRTFGSEGVIDADYFGAVSIGGTKPYEGGSTGNLYTDGAVTNIEEFHAAIGKGDASNPTVAPSVRSNLTAVFGREVGYSGGEMSWAEFLRTNPKLTLDTTALKA